MSAPSSGYFPVDLQGAYGLGGTVNAFAPGPGAPTIAIVDAYDDPNALNDLKAYRTALSGAKDPNTGLSDASIPPVCTTAGQTGCVTFRKVLPEGTPPGNSGWAEEISLDLDMVSAVCPNCNIDLVEAIDNNFSSLATAVGAAKALSPTPAAVTNSYGGGEFSGQTAYDSYYAATGTTAVTAATGDSGYGVEYPSSSAMDTAVGGTSLTYTGFGPGNVVWNAQTVWAKAGSGCSSQEPMPGWQAVSGVYELSADCSGRQVGDVSAVADPATGVAVYDTYGLSGWAVFGGTSASTQIIGAMYGLAAGASSIQPAASALYPDTASGPTGPTPGIVPVTSGSNGNCGNYLCKAGTGTLSSGYNGPAGLGTPLGIGAFTTGGGQPSGTLTFSPTSESGSAGAYLGQLTVTANPAPANPLTVNLVTTSTGGGFSANSGGTVTSSLQVTIPANATTSSAFWYRDTQAGSPTVTASAAGWGSTTLPVTITAGPATTVAVSPATATVKTGGTQPFSASASDQFGNPVAGASFTWATTAPGTVNPGPSTSTTFTAGSSGGSGSVTATLSTNSSVSGAASVTVTTAPAITVQVSAGALSSKHGTFQVPLTVTATSSGKALSGASATLKVYLGACSTGTLTTTKSGSTNTSGQFKYNFSTTKATSWCAVATVTKSGYSSGSSQVSFTT